MSLTGKKALVTGRKPRDRRAIAQTLAAEGRRGDPLGNQPTGRRTSSWRTRKGARPSRSRLAAGTPPLFRLRLRGQRRNSAASTSSSTMPASFGWANSRTFRSPTSMRCSMSTMGAQIVVSKAALADLGDGGRIIAIGSDFADRVPAWCSRLCRDEVALTAFTKKLARELDQKRMLWTSCSRVLSTPT